MNLDLNCDLGESFGDFKKGNDEKIIPLVSSVNIACGAHAGDPSVMAKTVALAKKHCAAIGCHPGFFDLQGFGRRSIQVSPEEVKHMVMYQLGALTAFARAENVRVSHLKPHGALYNMAAVDINIAKAIAEGIYLVDPTVKLMGLAGSEMIRAAQIVGIPYIREGFADRRYENNGTLASRKLENSVIETVDEVVEQVMQMVLTQSVTTRTGEVISLEVDSLCVHGDNEKAFEMVKAIKLALSVHDVSIEAVGRG